MAIAMSRPNDGWRRIVEGERAVQVASNLIKGDEFDTRREYAWLTLDEALIRSHASLYSTVGEFGENNSDVRA
jgi:hypothetical protein